MAAVEEAYSEPDDDRRDALLDEVIAAFRAMLVARPDLVRVRLELARAFFLKGKDSLAAKHFEEVLAGDVPDEVKANVRLFLVEIRARRRWSFNLGVAVAPGTNIGAGSDERIIINGLPFERDAEELTTSGVGLSFSGGAEYQAPVSERLRIRAGARASRREYKGSDFDQHFLGLHLGPRWLLDTATEASLLASARQSWSGAAPSHHDLGGHFEVAHRLGPRVTAFARASWHDRSYRSEHTSTARLGCYPARLVGCRADGAGRSFRGLFAAAPEVPARALARHGTLRGLPLGFTVGGSAEMRWTDYERGWFPFVADGGPREDRTRSWRPSAYNRALTLLGFSPEIAVVREIRKSNAQLHDYSRTSGELRFVRQF